jgi:F0F1-type ATP synthase membrane subunit b/b'
MITLASISETAAGIVEEFGIDWPLLLAQGVNFVIVAFVIWQFGLKKVLLTVKEREEKIADSLKNAEKIKLELEATEKQQQQTLQEASLEAKKNRCDGTGKSEILYRVSKRRSTQTSR